MPVFRSTVLPVETVYFAFGFAIGRALLQIGAFVVGDLALGYADLRLQLPVFPVEAQYNQCPAGDGGQAVKFVDLLFMEKEPADAFSDGNLMAGALVRLDVRVVEKCLALLDPDKGVGDVRLAG